MLQAEPRPTSAILEVVRTEVGVELKTKTGVLRIEPVDDAILRISVIEGSRWGEPALERVPSRSAPPEWTLVDGPLIVVATRHAQVHVRREDGTMVFGDGAGRPLVREADRSPRSLEKFDSQRTVFAESKVSRVQTPDGWKDVITDPKREFRKELYRARFSWTWADGEALYGLGQRDNGVLNLRGTRQYVHQANMKIAMPLLVSTRGYGLLFDTAAPLIFNDNENGSHVYLEAVEQPAYYFIQGKTLDGVVAGYRRITGRASLVPRWCLGYIQSQERYETQEELLQTVRECRRRGLPLDAIVLDWLSWTEGHWGQKTLDPTRFPDPRALTDQLHDLRARMMVSVWPTMAPKTQNHQEMKDHGHLFPLSETYDAFSAEARRLYWAQAKRGLFDFGIDGWWCDSSEPFTPEWNLVERPEPDRNYREFHETARIWIDEEKTNAYALWHAQGIDEGQRSVTDRKRVVNLTRSGWAGQQRFGTILWSGDTSASWETLKKQIPAGLGLSVSGLPYWTVDIGAFFTKRGKYWFWDGLYEEGSRDPAYRELYLRWFQFGAFLPQFRAHGTDTRREVWAFGEPGDPVYDTLARFLRLRYSLVPYLYSLAAGASLRGESLLRLLAFDFPDDPAVLDLKDQFLLGRAFLVCPVTDPIGPGPAVRPVHLPQGADWWDFWTLEKLGGGQRLQAAAPLERLPLYVRAGSIVPTAEPVQSTADLRDDRIVLRVFPGADGQFVLYQDDGESLDWEAGQGSQIPLAWDDGQRLLSCGAREGVWSGMPERIEFLVEVAGAPPVTLVYDGRPCQCRVP